ncbi:translocon-associated protein subunit delta-like [Gordionus sp. m RMFG-2023]|uniref:translocon-associated protein subunit delta-like n=1 Tax=Gordionus sp. m RMFG-2023 TaxID=3053472 RepID=UPI0031FC7C4F
MKYLFLFFIVFSYLTFYENIQIKKCIDPQFKHKIYTSSDGILATKSVVIIDFIVKCQNGLRDLNFYANIDGDFKPIAKSMDGSKYEITLQGDRNQLKSGNYLIKIYYAEDYSKIISVQGSNKDTNDIKPLYIIDYKHKGIYNGPMIKPQILIIIISALLWYFAYSTKYKIVN